MHLVQPQRVPRSKIETGRFVLPDLRPLSDLGCFARLTSLSIVNWVDGNFLIPTLFAPFSLLRGTIKYWKFVYPDYSYIDSYSLAFILDATIHLHARHFLFRPVLPLYARFPEYDVDDDHQDDEIAEEACSDSKGARTDFEIFASQWDEDGAEDDSELLQIHQLVERDVEEQLEFDNLKTLAVSVHTEIHLVLLLGTANVRNLKKLELCGPTIWILPEHVALLRRTISR